MSYLSRDPKEVKSPWVSETRTFQIHAKFWDGLSQDDQNRLIKRGKGYLVGHDGDLRFYSEQDGNFWRVLSGGVTRLVFQGDHSGC